MSRRRKNNTSLTESLIVGLIIVSIYAAIMWAIVYVCLIGLGIFVIYLLIKFIIDKTTTKKPIKVKEEEPVIITNDVNKEPVLNSTFQATTITPNNTKLSNKTEQTISTPYDNLFTNIIRARGISYYQKNKVKNYSYENETCKADIIGTEEYRTSIKFNQKNIIKVTCTCPYYLDNQKYCKHIYALLIAYCEKEKIPGYQKEEIKQIDNKADTSLYKKLQAILVRMSDIIDDTEDCYDSLEDPFEIENTYSEIMDYVDKIKEYENLKWDKVTEETISKANEDLANLEELCEELELDMQSISEPSDNVSSNKESNNKLTLGEKLFAAAAIIGSDDNVTRTSNTNSVYGLDKEESALVDRGEYDPWNFEEGSSGEDLDEDDYYADDDF